MDSQEVQWCACDLSLVADGFSCKRCDGTIQEVYYTWFVHVLNCTQSIMGSIDLELTKSLFPIENLDCWSFGVKFIIITGHKCLTFFINKRMDEMKPALTRKVIFLQHNFDIIHKD